MFARWCVAALLVAGLGACQKKEAPPAPAPTKPVASAPAPAPAPAPASAKASATGVPKGMPAEGTVTELQNGDLACYVLLQDGAGKEHNLMGEFELCEKPETYVKKKVRLAYKLGNVSDCESAEPCGKSKRVQLVHKLEVVK